MVYCCSAIFTAVHCTDQDVEISTCTDQDVEVSACTFLQAIHDFAGALVQICDNTMYFTSKHEKGSFSLIPPVIATPAIQWVKALY